jgi:NADPH:quinone reductase-like Zn-dependent oxidoreductase
MKAVGYRNSLPIAEAQSLVDVEIPDPVPGARDLLVEVKAISVNPVLPRPRHNAARPSGRHTAKVPYPAVFDVPS